MSKRPSLSKKLRFEVFKRDSFTCQYCGESAPSVVLNADHIHPVKEGGTTDLLNLITSCFACNAGKKDKLLSDDTAVKKQKAQLDELNERREQIEMMLEWRHGLQSLRDTEITAICDEWDSLTKTYSLSPHGIESAKKLLRKFGLVTVLDAMNIATQYFKIGADDLYISESVEQAWSKVGGICKMSTLPEWEKELHHIKNIAYKKWQYCDRWQLMDLMKSIYVENFASIEEIKQAVLSAKNWTAGKEQLAYLKDGS